MTKKEAQVLIDKILELQLLLEDRATYFKNEEISASKRYADLYVEIDIQLVKLGYVHTNPHKDLHSIWGYAKMNGLDTYAARRDYIRSLYEDIVFDLRRKALSAKENKKWRRANEELTDALQPIRVQWLKAKNFIHTNPPDFENSIKESINSVESALKILRGQPKDTLGKLVKHEKVDADIGRLISQAYGLVSNKDFVRHGGTSVQNLSREEAEFFLEFAAASIVYLKSKLDE